MGLFLRGPSSKTRMPFFNENNSSEDSVKITKLSTRNSGSACWHTLRTHAGSGFRPMKNRVHFCTALLLCALLIVPASSAKVTDVRVGWEEARHMLTAPSVRPPVQIVMQSGERLKGKLAEVTAMGLTVTRRGSDTVLDQGEIKQLRITHRTTRKKYRWLYGVGSYIVAGSAARAAGEHLQVHPLLPIGVLVAVIALPIYLYKIGARVDRGAVVIELEPATAAPDSPPTQ